MLSHTRKFESELEVISRCTQRTGVWDEIVNEMWGRVIVPVSLLPSPYLPIHFGTVQQVTPDDYVY